MLGVHLRIVPSREQCDHMLELNLTNISGQSYKASTIVNYD